MNESKHGFFKDDGSNHQIHSSNTVDMVIFSAIDSEDKDPRRLPDKVLQILLNLISNAKHALSKNTKNNKHIIIRVGYANTTLVRIEVIDNGMGIPKEDITRIFTYGFTTKEKGHGFGLHSGALSAKEMGGSLSVQSNGLGKGATFILELPNTPGENPYGYGR